MVAFISDKMVEGFYIPRDLGVRGLTSVQDCVEEEILSIGNYVIESPEKLLKVVEEELKLQRISIKNGMRS